MLFIRFANTTVYKYCFQAVLLVRNSKKKKRAVAIFYRGRCLSRGSARSLHPAQSWTEMNDLLSHVPDPKELPEPCNSQPPKLWGLLDLPPNMKMSKMLSS